MSHHAWAGIFLGLMVLAAALSLLISGPAAALVVLGSGAVPAIVSWGSMVLVIDMAATFDARRHDQMMLVNFFVKVIIVGVWTALALIVFKWPPALFASSLLINFLAWHLLEAAMYQRHLMSASRAGSQQNGDLLNRGIAGS